MYICSSEEYTYSIKYIYIYIYIYVMLVYKLSALPNNYVISYLCR